MNLEPDVGYGIKNITVTTKTGGQVKDVVFEREGNQIRFNMPEGSVDVKVELARVYKVTVNNPKLVSVYPEHAAAGTQVYVTPAPGYDLNLTVATEGGEPIQLNSDYSFVMPASNVKVTAVIRNKQAAADPAEVMAEDEASVNEDVALNSAADTEAKSEEQGDESEPQA